MAETVAIVGGTGREGRGLAARLGRAGRDVVIGSRDAARARATAEALVAASGGGMANADAANAAGIVVLATPFDGLDEVLLACGPALDGKLVVSAVIPLQVDDGRFGVRAVSEGSAAQLVAARAPRARVAAALHNVSARILADLDQDIEEDVPFACADADREAVRGLCADLGARGVFVGGLHLAPYLEGYTAVLLTVNRLYRVQAGIRITGLPETA
jgi:NADPH-dependent F420 reductase